MLLEEVDQKKENARKTREALTPTPSGTHIKENMAH